MRDKNGRLVKLVIDLTPTDFKAHPIWDLRGEDKKTGETFVSPVEDLPVTDLGNRIIGLQVTLNNGRTVWGLMGNVHLDNLRRTEQFLSMSIFCDGALFHLTRYFDTGLSVRFGPEALAKFLDMNVDDVFPIKYDLRPYVDGNSPPVFGSIPKEPRERLSNEARWAL